MSVHVRYNHIPKVVADLRGNMSDAIDSTCDAIADDADRTAPKRTGVLLRTTKSKEQGALHGTIESGIYRGHGFYAGFLEFGTRKMSAQPYMIPAAHRGERTLVDYATRAVRDACRV